MFLSKSRSKFTRGLITYVDDKYNVSIKTTVENSNVWEGLFLEFDHNSLQNKIIISNICG